MVKVLSLGKRSQSSTRTYPRLVQTERRIYSSPAADRFWPKFSKTLWYIGRVDSFRMEKCTCRKGRKCKTGPWWSHQSELNHHPTTSVQTHNCNFLKLKSLQDAIRHKARREEGGRDWEGGGVSLAQISRTSRLFPHSPPPPTGPPPTYPPLPFAWKRKRCPILQNRYEHKRAILRKTSQHLLDWIQRSQGCLFCCCCCFFPGTIGSTPPAIIIGDKTDQKKSVSTGLALNLCVNQSVTKNAQTDVARPRGVWLGGSLNGTPSERTT